MNATLKQLLIKAILGESFEEELQKVIGFYHDDFNDDMLRVQLRTLIGQGECISWYTNTCKTAQKANQKLD